jgi:hypothetical protein
VYTWRDCDSSSETDEGDNYDSDSSESNYDSSSRCSDASGVSIDQGYEPNYDSASGASEHTVNCLTARNLLDEFDEQKDEQDQADNGYQSSVSRASETGWMTRNKPGRLWRLPPLRLDRNLDGSVPSFPH